MMRLSVSYVGIYLTRKPVFSALSSIVVKPGQHTQATRGNLSFHIKCLRRILHIRWQDKVSNTDVLDRANMNSMFAIICERRLRWLGHVRRMDYISLFSLYIYTYIFRYLSHILLSSYIYIYIYIYLYY